MNKRLKPYLFFLGGVVTVCLLAAGIFGLNYALNFSPKSTGEHKIANKIVDNISFVPYLKDGNLYTNALNRAVRTLFYTVQKEFNGVLPYGEIDKDVQTTCINAILNYERFMYQNKFHQVSYVLDEFIRGINKYYTKAQAIYNQSNNIQDLKTAVVNLAHLIRVATVLCHPVVQTGSEKIAEYLNVDISKFYDWNYIFENIYYFVKDKNNHKLKEIPPKFDFFKKHPSQLISEE